MANQDMQRVVTGKVRLSFVHLFTPYSNKPGKEPKYSATILIPKSDYATRQRIDAAIAAAAQEGIAKWNGQRPPILHLPIHDGDGPKPSDGMPFGEECRGHWVMTASSKTDRKPDIIDANMNPIMNQSEIYSGCYARVSIRFFAYNAEGKKGVGCGLGNVQKLEDGQPLSGGSSAASDFGGGDAYAPPAPGGYQQPQYPPQTAYPQQPAYQQQVQPQYQQPAAYQQQPMQPQYPQQQPVYPQQPAQQPVQQPQYPQQPMQQPQYQQPPTYPQQPMQIDPITGRPMVGGIMGL